MGVPPFFFMLLREICYSADVFISVCNGRHLNVENQ